VNQAKETPDNFSMAARNGAQELSADILKKMHEDRDAAENKID